MKKKKKEPAYEQARVQLSGGPYAIVHRVPASWWYLFEQAHADPPPPKREAKAIGGAVEMVDDPDDPAYKELLKEVAARRAMALHQLVMDAAELEGPVAEVDAELMRSYGIEPTQENALRFYMIDHAVDFANLYAKTRWLSVVTEEAVQQTLDRFRDRLRGRVGSAGAGGPVIAVSVEGRDAVLPEGGAGESDDVGAVPGVAGADPE